MIFFSLNCCNFAFKEEICILGNLHRLIVFLEEGNGTPLQYSCLKNPMGRGVWWAIVHGVAKRVGHDFMTEQQIQVVQHDELIHVHITK